MSLLIGDLITLNLVHEKTNLQITQAASSNQQQQGVHKPCWSMSLWSQRSHTWNGVECPRSLHNTMSKW